MEYQVSHLDDVEPRHWGEGVEIRTVWTAGKRRALVVDIAPGARFPELDVHEPGDEEVFVVSGDFINHEGASYPAGTFLHFPAGSTHQPWSETGCRLFVFYPDG